MPDREPCLFKVCVFPRPGKRGAPIQYAYTRYFNPAWEGACLHHVMATRGALAKIAAIHAHKAGEGCRPNGMVKP